MIDSVLNGKYRVLRELGRGAMGVVYQAEHVLLGSLVAVKMLAPEFVANDQLRDRFFKEARTQSALRHPSVNRVVDYFEQDRHLFLVLEFVDGDSLAKLIEGGPMPQPQALALMSGVLDGLEYVHGEGVIHRDVKPSNILVDRTGRAVLIDFGIAVRAGGTRLTRVGGRVGSTHYMSPEQIERPQSLDKRTDIYSSGLVLFEMLTGTVPFDGGSDYDVEQKQINEAPPDPRKLAPSVTPRVAKAVLRALEKDPDRRFQTCAEFLAVLAATDPPPPGPKPRGLRVGLVLAALLAVVAAAYFGLGGRTPEPTTTVQPAAVNGHESGARPGNPAPSQVAVPDTATNVQAAPAIPPDEVFIIETLSLSALEQAIKYCRQNSERIRMEKQLAKAERTGSSDGARQYALELGLLEARIGKIQQDFSARLGELRSYPRDVVARLLSERRLASNADEAAYVSAIERHAASDAPNGWTLKESDCPRPPPRKRTESPAPAPSRSPAPAPYRGPAPAPQESPAPAPQESPAPAPYGSPASAPYR